jgi:hypothetical protein
MIIVKTYQYEGSVKIRCHYCGESFFKCFVKKLPNVHWDIPKTIKCKYCKTIEPLGKIPYLIGINKIELKKVFKEGGPKYSGGGTPTYIKDEHDYVRGNFSLRGRCGTFRFSGWR